MLRSMPKDWHNVDLFIVILCVLLKVQVKGIKANLPLLEIKNDLEPLPQKLHAAGEEWKLQAQKLFHNVPFYMTDGSWTHEISLEVYCVD